MKEIEKALSDLRTSIAKAEDQRKGAEDQRKALEDQRRRLEEQSNAQLATIQQRDQQIAALERKENAQAASLRDLERRIREETAQRAKLDDMLRAALKYLTKLSKWSDRLLQDYQRVLNSNRWRIGCWLSLKRADEKSKEASRLARFIASRPRPARPRSCDAPVAQKQAASSALPKRSSGDKVSPLPFPARLQRGGSSAREAWQLRAPAICSPTARSRPKGPGAAPKGAEAGEQLVARRPGTRPPDTPAKDDAANRSARSQGEHARSHHLAAEYVPRYDGEPLGESPVKLIAFYLPQFHSIPENDAFWGKGFTDWTYVQAARPQFVGHYQPHVPDELGYYDLLDPVVQERQVEMAKRYGVGGFCFYFYWFNGKRPLEKPVRNYLEHTKLDLPFCLCWANENWTRRWDGSEKEVLLTQNYSANDDLAFIEHISTYLRDPRYIRIDGKPLLVVYRPNLLPSAKETAQRWREWCRDNGLEEPYLIYAQSFERVDPAIYNFEAAIEFPPNMEASTFELPNLSKSVKPLRDDFACNVLDWSTCVEKSRRYTNPGYKLFRGVCPGWDNTPRRKNFSRVLHNSSPRAYREWLINAVSDTCERFQNPDERLIFVNAWNEWGEGTHLEPDARYGYAYLDATRLALADPVLESVCESIGNPRA